MTTGSQMTQPATAEIGRAVQFMRAARFDEAVDSFDKAIMFGARSAGVYFNRGLALGELGRLDDALASFDAAIAADARFAEGHACRGVTLQKLGRREDALAAYDAALAIKPGDAVAHANRGNVLQEMERFKEALASYREAIVLDPAAPKNYFDCGYVLQQLNRHQEALAQYDKALAADPVFPGAVFNRGMCRLALGEMAEGWAEFEEGWKLQGDMPPPPAIGVPEWMGEPLAGRSILIHGEPGNGDNLQFCRYLPLLAGQGADVTFMVKPSLVRLLRDLKGVRVVAEVPQGATYDFYGALLSMPARFGTELASVPAHVPYLAAEPERAALWRKAIGSHGYKIGIAWQGNVWQGGNYLLGRSFPLSELGVLAKSGARLISLQKEMGLDQLAILPDGMKVETLGAEFDAGPDAFLDTAAVMENLDLVICCDTAIAHLAGALGKPVWLALKYVPDWRWMRERTDSPWYPDMRLFRQPSPGDWGAVFAEMAKELRLP